MHPHPPSPLQLDTQNFLGCPFKEPVHKTADDHGPPTTLFCVGWTIGAFLGVCQAWKELLFLLRNDIPASPAWVLLRGGAIPPLTPALPRSVLHIPAHLLPSPGEARAQVPAGSLRVGVGGVESLVSPVWVYRSLFRTFLSDLYPDLWRLGRSQARAVSPTATVGWGWPCDRTAG